MSLIEAFVPVRTETLVAAEIPPPRKLLRQADCYQQCGVKYPPGRVWEMMQEWVKEGRGEERKKAANRKIDF